eukprot:9548675-Alexandrium_andersonii.AAC.1
MPPQHGDAAARLPLRGHRVVQNLRCDVGPCPGLHEPLAVDPHGGRGVPGWGRGRERRGVRGVLSIKATWVATNRRRIFDS